MEKKKLFTKPTKIAIECNCEEHFNILMDLLRTTYSRYEHVSILRSGYANPHLDIKNGSYAGKEWFLNENYECITFAEFEVRYLNKEISYEIY